MSIERQKQCFLDMLDAIGHIETYTEGLTVEAYAQDSRTVHAVERCILIISEAARRLGDDGAKLAPEIPWGDIRGIGNHLRHGYDTVSAEIVWNTINDHLPPLKQACLRSLIDLE